MPEAPGADNPLPSVSAEVVRLLDETERASGNGSTWIAPEAVRRLFWSYVFPLEKRTPAGVEAYFAKIPVATFKKTPLLPLSDRDRDAGRAEWDALRLLRARWPVRQGAVLAVEPVHFVEPLNAIVTKRIGGRHLNERIRADDCRARLLGRPRSDRLARLIRSFGQGLADFHYADLAEAAFPADAYKAKLAFYADELRGFGVSVALETGIAALGTSAETVTRCRVATTLKGLEIGNILVEDDGTAYLFDPGPAKMDVPEADLARLVVSCRILYWGTLRMAWLGEPSRVYEQRLLAGYESSARIDRSVYLLCLGKEILKIWRMCHRALADKSWPMPVERLAAKRYIDRFFASMFERLDEC